MLRSNNDEWARFPYGKQFFHLVTKISCPIKVNEGGCVSTSLLVISKGEPCGERKAALPRVKQLVPREGEMVRSGPPPFLLGAHCLAWGIWNFFISLQTLPSGTEGRNRGEKVLCWGAGSLLGESVKEGGGADRKGLGLLSQLVNH